jgi:hypothetical protein
VVPLAAVVILVGMAATGRLGGPKNCPHCGADLRALSSNTARASGSQPLP